MSRPFMSIRILYECKYPSSEYMSDNQRGDGVSDLLHPSSCCTTTKLLDVVCSFDLFFLPTFFVPHMVRESFKLQHKPEMLLKRTFSWHFPFQKQSQFQGHESIHSSILKFSNILIRTDLFCVQRTAMQQKEPLKDVVQKLNILFFKFASDYNP